LTHPDCEKLITSRRADQRGQALLSRTRKFCRSGLLSQVIALFLCCIFRHIKIMVKPRKATRVALPDDSSRRPGAVAAEKTASG
jgi:hypothetical protein